MAQTNLIPHFFRFALAAALLAITAVAACAHDLPYSYVNLHVAPGGIEGTCVVHAKDAGHDLGVPPEKLLDSVGARQQFPAIARLLNDRLSLQVDGRTATPEWQGITVLADEQALTISLRYPVTRVPGRVLVNGVLFPSDPNHQTYLNIDDGSAVSQAILNLTNPSFEYFSGAHQGVFAVIGKFLPAGIHHILIGPDHILFLVGLLLLGGKIRRLALIVSMFTLAHSITLSLAALDLVTPPVRLIEPGIALTIVFVGFDNLRAAGHRDIRTWMAFAFGFIHGFGFASVLREMALPPALWGGGFFRLMQASRLANY